MLPNGDPVLIVRVLEAFMALQFQAGVLTEEIVLAVQGLVEVSVSILAKRRVLLLLPYVEGDRAKPLSLSCFPDMSTDTWRFAELGWVLEVAWIET